MKANEKENIYEYKSNYWKEHPLQLPPCNGATGNQWRNPEVFRIADRPESVKVTVEKLKKAIDEAYMEGESKLRGNAKSVPPLKAIKTPLRDGDLERPDDPAYENSYFLNANSTTKPGVVDGNNQPVLDASELYSGIYGRASISFYAFNTNGNRGIACGLNALQKLRDGEPLGAHIDAETEFAGLDDSDDDFLA